MTATYAFRPRYRRLAWSSIGLGGGLAGLGVAIGVAMVPIAAGALGVVFGAAYLASPAWGFSIVTDDAGLEVRDKKGTRFRLAWGDIVRVVASPSTHTCFIDGGAPERSVLVPGLGAPAPYEIVGREALFATVLERVPAERVETVETLDKKPASAPAPT